LAEWREGVWTRPANLAGDLPEVDCTWMLASLVAADRAAALAASLWDLGGWAARGAELQVGMASTVGALVAGDTSALAPCFITAAAVVRHIASDPLLPSSLLPPGWPGLELRSAYDAYESAYQSLLRSWLAGLDR
jgi:phenylacetic acid degradation operon negative regulatory protein